jgi:hypothetical protein
MCAEDWYRSQPPLLLPPQTHEARASVTEQTAMPHSMWPPAAQAPALLHSAIAQQELNIARYRLSLCWEAIHTHVRTQLLWYSDVTCMLEGCQVLHIKMIIHPGFVVGVMLILQCVDGLCALCLAHL